METQEHIRYRMPVAWDDEYRKLDYINEPFNDPQLVQYWLARGYSDRFTGDMCDMRSPQPTWNSYILGWFIQRGWRNIGTSYYRMSTGTVLPRHSDRYKKYVDRYQLQGQEHTIRRAIVFLEDWQPGHYLEVGNEVIAAWTAGTVVEWQYDTPHAAANLGLTDRYTLQVTGCR